MPLIAGAWLRPGQHVDLVGAFNMRMREADDEALKRARIFVDTEAACVEGGDVALGLRDGAIIALDVVADLAALCRGAKGRRAADEITLFKSVGASIEDLAAAMLVWRKAGGADSRLRGRQRPNFHKIPYILLPCGYRCSAIRRRGLE